VSVAGDSIWEFTVQFSADFTYVAAGQVLALPSGDVSEYGRHLNYAVSPFQGALNRAHAVATLLALSSARSLSRFGRHSIMKFFPPELLRKMQGFLV
jgi:hypothetical protein